MDPDFWHQRWQENQIGFHERNGNALLAKYFDRLSLARGDRVFVPLCGKSNDIGWLAAQGCRVVGIELSQTAVEAFFAENGLEAEVSRAGALTCYASGPIELFAGDFFKLSKETLGAVDAVYDRAALVAMPDSMRAAYADHLTRVTGCAPQLLIAFDYDQTQMEGPPFSVPEATIGELYGRLYNREQLASLEISGLLAERCSGAENAWLLSPK